jgi:hypothetical protein
MPTRLLRCTLLLVLLGGAVLLAPLYLSRNPTFATSSSPPYATVGAFANYTGDGGFIPFLSGVSGNLSYLVTNVLSNGSMSLLVTGNLSMGTEVGIPTSNVSLSLMDSIETPTYFPAIPPQALLSHQIIFQNITCNFVKNDVVTVPAGTFDSVEYQGTGANNSILDFWFDNQTGLALQMSGTASELQLTYSNIASPLAAQSATNLEIDISAVFIGGWVFAGLLFYAIRRHYIRKSNLRDQKEQNAPRPKKPGQLGN